MRARDMPLEPRAVDSGAAISRKYKNRSKFDLPPHSTRGSNSEFWGILDLPWGPWDAQNGEKLKI